MDEETEQGTEGAAVATTSREFVGDGLEVVSANLPPTVYSFVSGYWAIEQAFMSWAFDTLSGMSASDIMEAQREFRARSEASSSVGGEEKKPYKVYDRIAHIPIVGVMTKRPTCMSDLIGGGVSTMRVRQMLRAADADLDVVSKLLNIESPGGDTSGVFDLADDVANGRKPTDTFYEDMGASAALLVGSGGRVSSANKNAALGSAGVYTVLPDSKKAKEQAGVKVYVVKAGRFKATGHPGTEVTEDQLSHMQGRVDAMHGLFLRALIRGRPGMTKAQLAEVADAGVFIGAHGKRLGLVDNITNLDGAHKQAMKSNAEGTRRVTVVKDEQLAAWLSATAPTTQAVDQAAQAAAGAEAPTDTTPAPAQAVTSDGTAPAAPAAAQVVRSDATATSLLAALTAIGVASADDLRSLAAEAMVARSMASELRERALGLAVALYKDSAGQGTHLLASAETFIKSAPFEVLKATVEQYEAQLVAAGLAAPQPGQVARRFTAPAPVQGGVPVDATTTPKATVPEAVDTYVQGAYGAHAANGKGA
jgi:capsid assembly protease